MTPPKKEAPWLFRTYAGHSTARASNALYRNNRNGTLILPIKRDIRDDNWRQSKCSRPSSSKDKEGHTVEEATRHNSSNTSSQIPVSRRKIQEGVGKIPCGRS